MFNKAKSLVKNHWKKAVYAAVGVKAISYGLSYAANKIITYHEEQNKELWIKLKKKELFEKTDSNAVSTFVSLLPTLRATIERILDSDALTKSLKSNLANKLEAWEELKIIAFSRVLASVYGSAILNMLIRIQLHVIGGYVIQASVSSQLPRSSSDEDVRDGSKKRSMTAEIQVEYLGLADYFIRDGMERLCIFLQRHVEAVVRPIPLKRRVSVQDIEQIVWHIIEKIRQSSSHANPVSALTQYVFPPEILRRYNNFEANFDPVCLPEEPVDLLEQLMSETYDLLNCTDAASLLSSLETHGVSHFLDRLMDIIPDMSMSQSMSASMNASTSSEGAAETSNTSADTSLNASSTPKHPMEEIAVPLARVIPPINSYAPGNLNDSDPWIITIAKADPVKIFAANVYESFSSPIPAAL